MVPQTMTTCLKVVEDKTKDNYFCHSILPLYSYQYVFLIISWGHLTVIHADLTSQNNDLALVPQMSPGPFLWLSCMCGQWPSRQRHCWKKTLCTGGPQVKVWHIFPENSYLEHFGGLLSMHGFTSDFADWSLTLCPCWCTKMLASLP